MPEAYLLWRKSIELDSDHKIACVYAKCSGQILLLSLKQIIPCTSGAIVH